MLNVNVPFSVVSGFPFFVTFFLIVSEPTLRVLVKSAVALVELIVPVMVPVAGSTVKSASEVSSTLNLTPCGRPVISFFCVSLSVNSATPSVNVTPLNVPLKSVFTESSALRIDTLNLKVLVVDLSAAYSETTLLETSRSPVLTLFVNVIVAPVSIVAPAFTVTG